MFVKTSDVPWQTRNPILHNFLPMGPRYGPGGPTHFQAYLDAYARNAGWAEQNLKPETTMPELPQPTCPPALTPEAEQALRFIQENWGTFQKAAEAIEVHRRYALAMEEERRRKSWLLFGFALGGFTLGYILAARPKMEKAEDFEEFEEKTEVGASASAEAT